MYRLADMNPHTPPYTYTENDVQRIRKPRDHERIYTRDNSTQNHPETQSRRDSSTNVNKKKSEQVVYKNTPSST